MSRAQRAKDERDDRQIKSQVQVQFGPQAEQYVTSQTHAQGWSLARLSALVQPEPGWHVLDVATGGGHTALLFAPHVLHMVALDLTQDMLRAARRHMTEQGTTNASFTQADAEKLPFRDDCFHLVTCRIAAHHFPDVGDFLREVARVLQPGGWAAITDNVTPGDRRASTFLNAFDRLRDPSHQRAYSLEDWLIFVADAGLEVTHQESDHKTIDLDEWAARMSVSEEDVTRLRVMLAQAPTSAREALLPRQVGSRTVFELHEAIVIGRKPT